MDTELLGELEGFLGDFHILLICKGIARAVECAQRQAARAHRVVPFCACRFVRNDRVKIDVRGARPVACADFQAGNAFTHTEVKHFFVGHIQGAGLNTEFHGHIPHFCLKYFVQFVFVRNDVSQRVQKK